MATAASLGVPPGPQPASPRQRLWRVLRWCHAPRSLGELYAAAEIEPELFFSLIESWSARGFILSLVNPLRFIMTEAARSRTCAPSALPDKPKSSVPKHSGRQRLWAAMRVLKEFDLVTIAMAAEVGEKGASEFLTCLARVDYLMVIPSTEERSTNYRLVRNTGPKHPVVRRRLEGPVSIVELDDRNDGTSRRNEIDYSARRLDQAPLRNGGVS